MSAVLDASALLAWLRGEPGADQVDAVLNGAVIGAVNASEVAQKLIQNGADAPRALTQVLGLGLAVEPCGFDDALGAAELWACTRAHGLSLGDRAFLALARRLGARAFTADKAWSRLDAEQLGVEVHLIR